MSATAMSATAMSATAMSATATEWGPAKHDPEHPLHRHPRGPLERAELSGRHLTIALRDDDAARPDDN